MSELQTREQFIQVQGGQVFVKSWIPHLLTKDVPLILLHDSLGCTQMWREFPAELAEQTGRTVVAYDRLGFGKSSKRTELPSIRFVEEEGEIYLPAILNHLNIDKFILFGHSVGGGMSICAPGMLGERCLAVITESAQAFVEDRTREGIEKAQIDFADPQVFVKLERYHGEKTQWVLDAWIKIWLSKEFAHWSLKDALPLMKCPVLIIHGDRDEYGSIKFPEMIAELAGGVVQKEIILNCGHVPHREKSDVVLKLIADFLVGKK